MKNKSRQLSIAALAAVAVAAVVWFTVLDWIESGPFHTLISNDLADFRILANNLARSSITLISTVFSCLFLAIPMTATMYTPQLIENFWRARTNRIVLGVYVFSAGNAVWLSHLSTDGGVPRIHATLSLVLVMSTLVILLPYLYSVFRLLSPDSIIARVQANAIEAMHRTAGEVTERQSRINRRLDELGAILLRTLERGDRDIAMTATGALETTARRWLEIKSRHESAFFLVDSSQFPGLSPLAIRLVNDERTWVEMMLLQQLARGFGAALARVPDVISAISRCLRHFAVAAAERGDHGALDLSMRYLNNFVREAVKRRDLHAIYDLIYQARELAAKLWPISPDRVVNLVARLDEYGSRAAQSGIPFAHGIVAHDAGRILSTAADGSESWQRLFDRYLQIGRNDTGIPEFSIVKARLVTAARLLEAGRGAEARRLRASLDACPPDLLERARQDILGTTEPWFWEVTDRQENLDWLEPSARAQLDLL